VGARNITIPLGLFMKIADLLGYWDISSYDYAIQCAYDEVADAMDEKLRSMELRLAYSKIVFAKDEEARFDARIDYLKKKNAPRI